MHYKYPNEKKHNMVYSNWIVYKRVDKILFLLIC